MTTATRTTDLTGTEDAIIGILVGAMHADGHGHRAEAKAATLHLENMEPTVRVTPQAFAARAEALKAALDAEGPDAFLARCAAAVPADARKAAFSAVVAVLRADHEVTPAESAFLRRAAVLLGLPDADAAATLRAGPRG